MKRYNITVNGKTYSVDVEEVDLRKANKKSEASFESQDPQSDLQPIEISSSDIEVQGVEQSVISPLSGTVVNITKQQGDRVSYGETLVVLSNNETENDIGAPKDGVVSEVFVKAGDAVEVDTVMLIIN